MAEIGSIPIKFRLSIEAGIGDTLHPLGVVDDLEIDVPLAGQLSSDGAEFHLGRLDIPARLTAAVAAFEAALRSDSVKHEVCITHRVVQHRDGKPPWCNYCGLDAAGNTPGVELLADIHTTPPRGMSAQGEGRSGL